MLLLSKGHRAGLRVGCNVTIWLGMQTKMSQKKWSEIDYERVASLCMKINKKHFIKYDKDRLKVQPQLTCPSPHT